MAQRNEASFGLMDYNARYYSPVLGRFVSPDSIVPEPSLSGGFNRYRYARNSPLMYSDESGHCVITCIVLGIAGLGALWMASTDDAKAPISAHSYYEGSSTSKQKAIRNQMTNLMEDFDALETFARTTEYAAELTENDTDAFMANITPVLSGYEANGVDGTVLEGLTELAGHTVGIETGEGMHPSRYYDKYLVQYRSSSGFGSHVADPNPEDNQIQHVWYWVQVSYYNTNIVAYSGNIAHESENNPGASYPDLVAGQIGIDIGSGLKSGSIKPNDVADLIRQKLGVQD